MHDRTGFVLEAEIAGVARAQVGFVQCLERIREEVVGSGIDVRILPGGTKAGLAAAGEIETALAGGIGDEAGVGRGMFDVPAA